jgi:hypothetical protein
MCGIGAFILCLLVIWLLVNRELADHENSSTAGVFQTVGYCPS